MINCGIDHMSGHSQREVGKRAERGKIACLEGRTVGLNNGKTAMTVDGCAAVASSVPVLAGEASERAQAALDRRKPSDKDDAAALRLEWARLIAGDEMVGARS